MDTQSQKAVEDFAERVRRCLPDARIWVFGSRVRGTHGEFSDLDLCVVAPRLDDAADRYIMDCAWDAGFAHDLVITTVTYSREEFEDGPCSASPLVQSIQLEGLVV
ncbi:MAG TPA: nucleotidyltransferase domain-containing protein [Planctomycetota bacterium]|nr:nucleotidyltransferase domain-containing protein [Planctomycetota bacterium]HRR78911.1 nucleotidyltransferase domain-containing protein [Planctomycetota bacterium]HRT92811.1 nucleotidyltransferase domain-containing protein [Planctomycetota bacterium]